MVFLNHFSQLILGIVAGRDSIVRASLIAHLLTVHIRLMLQVVVHLAWSRHASAVVGDHLGVLRITLFHSRCALSNCVKFEQLSEATVCQVLEIRVRMIVNGVEEVAAHHVAAVLVAKAVLMRAQALVLVVVLMESNGHLHW